MTDWSNHAICCGYMHGNCMLVDVSIGTDLHVSCVGPTDVPGLHSSFVVLFH